MNFSAVTPAPADPILGLTEAFKNDPRSGKVNLGVGVYVDDQGRTPVLESVRQAERILLESEKTKSYLPISGGADFASCLLALALGEPLPAPAERLRVAQTPGGTGALRLGAEFLRHQAPAGKVWLSRPTWPNHRGVFAAAGFDVGEYPYYDPATRGVAWTALAEQLDRIPEGDIVVLHVCCHNPTGADLTSEQWKRVAEIAETRRWFPFFDFAYQGFGEGLEKDRAGVLAFVERGLEFFAATSFSKNFGLYNERVGALLLSAAIPAGAEAAFSQIKASARTLYSNPPAHGSAILTTILKDAGLRGLWKKELDTMRGRIWSIRSDFVAGLHRRGATMDFSFIRNQRGMFSFSGLNDAQVSYLREKKGIYMVGGGRINVAGMTSANLDIVCDSVVEALQHAR